MNPTTGQREPRSLKRDQALFVAKFAHACNAVWEDEQTIAEGTLAVKDKRCFNFFLIGQGGSGKTALVQEIVLPTMDSLFPPNDEGNVSSVIICSKWS